MLRDILHKLFFSILRVKPSQEVKGDRLLLWYLLIQNLDPQKWTFTQWSQAFLFYGDYTLRMIYDEWLSCSVLVVPSYTHF